MGKRTTASAVRHNGVLYQRGAELNLDEAAERQLEALGVLEPADGLGAGDLAVGAKRRRGKAAELDLDAEADAAEVQFGGGRADLEPGDL